MPSGALKRQAGGSLGEQGPVYGTAALALDGVWELGSRWGAAAELPGIWPGSFCPAPSWLLLQQQQGLGSRGLRDQWLVWLGIWRLP